MNNGFPWLAFFGAAQALLVLIPFAVEICFSAAKGYAGNRTIAIIETAALAAAAFASAANVKGWPSVGNMLIYIIGVPVFSVISVVFMIIFISRRAKAAGIVYALSGGAALLMSGATIFSLPLILFVIAASAVHTAAVSGRFEIRNR